ncbi:hypothetical protein [Streptosporangium sp. 'caverna']|uniref:hypothetical protein n=1 Tax=Streptosporangium sp. 'caverna' TaxID=2202249 RepID=UPI000D7D538A|nr:hypothetical protein [Streptosporangium sp. 'caverna']AWS46451.1 hypothetical protein DKM19_39260 [Streptosporangium sp. 'caverna']
MQASHADFRSADTGLTSVGADHSAEVRVLRAYLEGEGDPWGDDELGSTVGAAYRAVTRQALEACESLARRHTTAGGDVGTMSVNYRSAERRGEEEADRITRAVRRV